MADDAGGGGGGSPYASEIDELIEAAINAYMRDHAEQARDLGVYGSCADGYFRFVRAKGPGSRDYSARYWEVSYPDGVWSSGGLGDSGTTGAPRDESALFDARQHWGDIRSDFEDRLRRWADIPSPASFEDQIEALQAIATDLAAGGATLEGDGSKKGIAIGNLELDSYIKTLESELDNLEGTYVERLRKFVNDRVRDVIAGHHALACVAGTVVAGEKEIWVRADKDFRALLKDGTSSFTTYAEQAAAIDSGTRLDVIGALLSAAGLFVIGPAGVTLGLLKEGAALAKTFAPKTPKAPTTKLSGNSYEELVNAFWTKERDIDQAISDTEEAFAKCATNARDSISDHRCAYDMREQTKFLSSDGEGIYGPGEQRIKVNEDLKDAAPNFELVGDHQRAVARRVEATQSSASWERDATLGFGHNGHYPQYEALLGDLTGLLLNSAKEMHAYAEKCLLIYHDFNATDDAIESELDRRAASLERTTEYEVGH